jgi:catechol 2,3-dioxygenase-like lactoylglutathione lyase family enzyme
VRDLQTDREVVRGSDGGAHFIPDFGFPMALCRTAKRPVITAPDPVNSPGNVNRLNKQRKWHVRARPRVINHITIAVEDFEQTFEFLRKRLGFRLTDRQGRFGLYCRADGARVHHSMAILDAKGGIFGTDGSLGFHHANFGVEDIDEIMVGANYMERRGWPKSHMGLGRHRIDSALFLYLPCPAGGEAEYGADQDVIDDSWIPRDWYVETFGFITFISNMPDMLKIEPEWAFRYLKGAVPDGRAPTE